MSALPPKADIRRLIRLPRPRARLAVWDVEAEHFGGLQVDYQLKPGRRLNRKIARLLPLEDAIDIAGGASVLVDVISPYDIRPPAVTR